MVRTEIDGLKIVKIGGIELGFPDYMTEEQIMSNPLQDVMQNGFRV